MIFNVYNNKTIGLAQHYYYSTMVHSLTPHIISVYCCSVYTTLLYYTGRCSSARSSVVIKYLMSILHSTYDCRGKLIRIHTLQLVKLK